MRVRRTVDSVSVSAAAARYDHSVGPFARPFAAAIARAVTRGGAVTKGGAAQSVLDHGAGTGLVTKLLRRWDPSLAITALDPSEEFLTGLRGESNVEILVGTASAARPRSYGAIVSNLALMFCADPLEDLRALRRAATHGASLHLTVLGPVEEVQPFWRYWSAVAAVVPGAWSPDRYRHHCLGDARLLAPMVVAAGWDDVSITKIRSSRRIGAAAAWRWLVGALPVGRCVNGDESYGPLETCYHDAVRAAFLQAWPDRTWPTSAALLVGARAGRSGPT